MEQVLPSQISCLLLPVEGKNLLLPNASIAEIVDYQTPERPHEAPDWFLGYIRWRGLRLPIVSYEGANENPISDVASQARIAVTNTIGGHQPPLSFIAFVTRGIPRLIKVNKEEIATGETDQLGPAEKVLVRVSGEEAMIPELVYLEKLATEAVSKY